MTSSWTGSRRARSCRGASPRRTGVGPPCAGPTAAGRRAPSDRRGRSGPPGSRSSAGRRPAARSACFRITHRPGAGSTAPSARWAPRSAGRPRSCPCSATPVERAWPARGPVPASPTSTPRSRPSPGRAGTPRRRGWRIARSAGWPTTCGRSCAASDAGAGPTTARSPTPRPTGTAGHPGRSTTTCRRSSTTSRRSSGRDRRLVLLSAHTPGYDGERLAALGREHLGVAATAGELRLTATSGNVLRLGGWARSPAR